MELRTAISLKQAGSWDVIGQLLTLRLKHRCVEWMVSLFEGVKQAGDSWTFYDPGTSLQETMLLAPSLFDIKYPDSWWGSVHRSPQRKTIRIPRASYGADHARQIPLKLPSESVVSVGELAVLTLLLEHHGQLPLKGYVRTSALTGGLRLFCGHNEGENILRVMTGTDELRKADYGMAFSQNEK